MKEPLDEVEGFVVIFIIMFGLIVIAALISSFVK
jgi:hypothetical protein